MHTHMIKIKTHNELIDQSPSVNVLFVIAIVPKGSRVINIAWLISVL